MARWLALTLAALVAAPAAAVVSDGAVGEARAQVWKPKKQRAKKKAKKPAKKRPAAKKKPPHVPGGTGDDDEDDDRLGSHRRVEEPEPEPEPEVEDDGDGDGDGGGDGGGDGDGDEGGDGGGDDGGDDDSSDGDSFRIDDDLDDVGATVTFDADDLATDDAGSGNTRLETKALAFGRLGIDTIQDPPPNVSSTLAGSGEDILGFRVHGRAESVSRFGTRYKVKVAGRADAELGIDADTQLGVERYEAEIWDTYADAYFSALDVRFGKQIIAWGTADLISPNDVVNARDLRRGIAVDPDELRIPTLALSARAFTGPLSLQGVWIPVAPQNRFDLLDGDYAILGPHAATVTERRVGALVSALADDPMLGPTVSPILGIGGDPDNGIDTGELGAQGSIETRRFDVHAYFLWGHERTPRIAVADELRDFLIMTPPDMLTPEALAERVALLAQQGVAAVTVDQPRRVHAGAAFATRIEPLGIKLDAAWSPKVNTVLVVPGAGPVLGRPDQLAQALATLSLDYDRGTELSVVVEASHLRVLDVPEGEQVFQMTKGDQLTIVGTRVSWNPRSGPMTLTALGFFDVDSQSYAARPALELSGHDHWALEIAAAIYGGGEGTFGGVYTDADEVTLTVQYGL